ncbi:MAG: tetratricopeptide repeat protein [Campylobacterales bacterium]
MKQLLLVLLFFAGTLLADNTPKCQEFNTTQLKEYEGCLQKFAEQGDFSATKQLANFYYAGPQSYKNYKKAVEWYMKVEAQDAKSQYTIGQIYTFGGYGIEKDYKQAAYWYEKSMSNGNLGGMVNMAYFYVQGWGVEQDCKKSLELYRQAAGKNFWPAQDSLGHLYFEGKCVTKDIEKAKYWIRKGLLNGNTNTWFWHKQNWGPIE